MCPREPAVAHLYNVAPHQSGSTFGEYDASLGLQGAAGAAAVRRPDLWRPQTLQVAPWRAKCRRNTPSGHVTPRLRLGRGQGECERLHTAGFPQGDNEMPQIPPDLVVKSQPTDIIDIIATIVKPLALAMGI